MVLFADDEYVTPLAPYILLAIVSIFSFMLSSNGYIGAKSSVLFSNYSTN